MITKQDVKKISGLAKLKLSEQELQRTTNELGNILGFVEKLNELKLDNVEATSHAVNVTNVFREDEPKKSTVHAKTFLASPDMEGDLFKVPRVI